MGKQSRLLEILPNVLLFFLFTCCMFLVLLTGAKIYRTISDVMEEQFSVTTCVGYVTAKVRHYDTEDAVSVGMLGNVESLILKEKINGKEYLTYLYCADGDLMELFCGAEMEAEPADGQSIMPLDGLDFDLEGNILSFTCEAEGETAEGVVALQSGKGAAE